jgi:hypothetical protein
MKYTVGDIVKDGWGRKVRIICIDMDDLDYPVVGLVKLVNGGEAPYCYTAKGKAFDDENLKDDLID